MANATTMALQTFCTQTNAPAHFSPADKSSFQRLIKKLFVKRKDMLMSFVVRTQTIVADILVAQEKDNK